MTIQNLTFNQITKMENNEHTRIGTFCEKCRNVVCMCNLHPSIVHISASEPLSDESVEIINKMVEKASTVVVKKPICERCEKDVDEVFMCELCETMICDKCSSTYNQFTQIDFNCCKSCANNRD